MVEGNTVPADTGTRTLSIRQIDEVDRLLDKLKWLGSVAGLVAQHLEETGAAGDGLLAVLHAVNLIDSETGATAEQLREIAGTPGRSWKPQQAAQAT